MRSKGLLAISIDYMVVLLLAASIFSMAFFATQALSVEVEESVDDLGRISRANFYTESFFYNFLPLGASYSLHQRAAELGPEGGGDHIKWNQRTVVKNGDVINVLGPIQQEYRSSSIDYLRNKYPTESTGTICELEEKVEPVIGLNDRYPVDKNIRNASFNLLLSDIRTMCGFSKGEVRYKGSSEDFYASNRADDNRYITMASDTAKFFNDLKGRWSSSSLESATGTVASSCGHTPPASVLYDDAEQEAVNSLESRIRSRLSSAVSNYKNNVKKDGLEVNKSKTVDDSYSFTFGTSSNVFNGTSTPQGAYINCCSGCRMGTSSDYQTIVSVRVNSDVSKAEWALKDDKYRIPTEDGWKNLFFKVEPPRPYYHDFDSDSRSFDEPYPVLQDTNVENKTDSVEAFIEFENFGESGEVSATFSLLDDDGNQLESGEEILQVDKGETKAAIIELSQPDDWAVYDINVEAN